MPSLPLFSCPCAAVIATALPLGACRRSSCPAQRRRTAAVAVARTGQRFPASQKHAALVRRFLLLLTTHMLTECEQLAPLHGLEPPHLSCARGEQPEPVPLHMHNSSVCGHVHANTPLFSLCCFQQHLSHNINAYEWVGLILLLGGRDTCGAVGKQKA